MKARLRGFALIVSTAPDSIITVGQHGLIVAANPAAARIFGSEAGALVGRRVDTVLPDFDKVAQVGEAMPRAVGSARWRRHALSGELSVGTTENETPALRIAVTRDITRRKALEPRLRAAALLAAAR